MLAIKCPAALKLDADTVPIQNGIEPDCWLQRIPLLVGMESNMNDEPRLSAPLLSWRIGDGI
jgi:hypothetical protein